MSQLDINDGNIYEIHYVRSEIMHCIIDFAYTFDCGIKEKTHSELSELMATAEYFCFFPLVDHCAECMMNILNADNCIWFMRATRFL